MKLSSRPLATACAFSLSISRNMWRTLDWLSLRQAMWKSKVGMLGRNGRNSTATGRICRNVSGTRATPKPADTNPSRLSAPSASQFHHRKKLTEETCYAQKNRLKTFYRVSDVEVACFAAAGGLGKSDRTLTLSQN